MSDIAPSTLRDGDVVEATYKGANAGEWTVTGKVWSGTSDGPCVGSNALRGAQPRPEPIYLHPRRAGHE